MWIQYENTSCWRLQAQSRVMFEPEAEESPRLSFSRGGPCRERALIDCQFRRAIDLKLQVGQLLSEIVLEPPRPWDQLRGAWFWIGEHFLIWNVVSERWRPIPYQRLDTNLAGIHVGLDSLAEGHGLYLREATRHGASVQAAGKFFLWEWAERWLKVALPSFAWKVSALRGDRL